MFKVCLDPGHGADTAGKRSFDGTLREFEFNRDVANRIKKYLEKAGVQVVITAATDKDVTLGQRCRIANNAKADLFVSIHANAAGTTWNEARGWEIFVCKKGGKAEKLAEAIHKASLPCLGLKDRGVKENKELYVLKNTDMPAVLIEHGFYSNKDECALLKSSEFREKCAIADTKGILNYLGIPFKG
jgi:N-acetylmuramoyl-L-alanine amidase